MSLKLFEFHKKSMIVACLINLSQFEKTGPTVKMYFAGNSIYQIPLFLFESGVCPPFNKRNEVNLKKSK